MTCTHPFMNVWCHTELWTCSHHLMKSVEKWGRSNILKYYHPALRGLEGVWRNDVLKNWPSNLQRIHAQLRDSMCSKQPPTEIKEEWCFVQTEDTRPQQSFRCPFLEESHGLSENALASSPPFCVSEGKFHLQSHTVHTFTVYGSLTFKDYGQ